MLLVTGATGHSAKFFFDTLVKQEYQKRIRCLVRETSQIESLQKLDLDLEFFYADFQDITHLKESMIGIDVVLHITGLPYSEKIIRAGNEMGVDWLICVHTTAVFSKYRMAYSMYKEVEDRLLTKYSNLTILRPTMIYGSSKDKNMWKLINYLHSHKFFPVFGSGKNFLQPVHAKDLGLAYAFVLQNKKVTYGKQYNLAGKERISYLNLLKEISTSLDKKIVFIHLPLWVSFLMIYLYNFFFNNPSITAEQVLRMNEDRTFNYHDAYSDFGFTPMSFQKGIKLEVEEFLEKLRDNKS